LIEDLLSLYCCLLPAKKHWSNNQKTDLGFGCVAAFGIGVFHFMVNEIWKEVKGYEGLYEVSSNARVRSLDRVTMVKNREAIFKKYFKGKILKIGIDTYGYPSLGLSCNGKHKTVLIHRLVAEAFIPNPENKREVNHINGVKTDNRVENLEWATPKENTKHAFSTGLAKAKKGAENKRSKPVSQFTLEGILIKNWASARDVFIETGFDNSNILKTIKGNFKHAYGFIWKFTEQ